jgi:Adenosine deaminase
VIPRGKLVRSGLDRDLLAGRLGKLEVLMRRRTFLDLLVAGVAGVAVRPSITVTAQPTTWHERLPKVELHLHLEGAIPKPTLWELITKYGGDPAIRTRDDLDRALIYRDFGGFLKMWVWMIGYLREYDDYALIGESVARDLARQNIRYVEGFFSPPDYRRSTLDPQRVTEALRTGVNRVSSIEIALVADLVRDRGVDHARNLLERLGEVRKHGVIGIGIAALSPAFLPSCSRPRTSVHERSGSGPRRMRAKPRERPVCGERFVRCVSTGSDMRPAPSRMRSWSSISPSGVSRWSCVRFPTSERASSSPSRRTRYDTSSTRVFRSASTRTIRCSLAIRSPWSSRARNALTVSRARRSGA